MFPLHTAMFPTVFITATSMEIQQLTKLFLQKDFPLYFAQNAYF